MCRIITLVSFVLVLISACENPADSDRHEEKLISKLVGEWTKVGERTKLDTFCLCIEESSLNCGVPFLWRDTLSIAIDCQYTRMRAAADPDCCSTVFSIYERGHLEIVSFTAFYVVADSLLIGFCELCQNPEPKSEIDVSSGALRLLCCVESDTIFAIGDGTSNCREPYWCR